MILKKFALILASIWVTNLGSLAYAQTNDTIQDKIVLNNWERFSVNLGGFIAGVNTGFRLGSKQLGIGVDIKLEDALGLKASNFVFRGDAMYRFGQTKKHGVKFGYFGFSRAAYKVLETELELGDKVYPIGTEISSIFDLSIFNFSYDYTFFGDNRVNLGTSIGLFIMPLKFRLDVSGVTEETTNLLAPLPVFGLRSDFSISSKLFLKHGLEILYLQAGDYTGILMDLNVRLEYNPWKHFGFGTGINMYRMKVEVDGNDFDHSKFVGNIEMGYTGMQFYGRYLF